MKLRTNFDRYTVNPLFYFKMYGIDLLSPTTLGQQCLFAFVIANFIVMQIHLVAFLMAPGDRLAELSTCVSCINYFSVGMGKVLAMAWNRQALTRNYHNLRTHYPSADIERRYRLERHLRTYALVERFLGKFFKYIVIVYVGYPLAQSCWDWWTGGAYGYRMVLVMWYPVDVKHAPWAYVVYFLLESLGSFHVGMAILSSDLSLFGSVSQLAQHFDLLTQQILELQPQQPESLGQLKNIIERHQIVLRLADDVNHIFTPPVMFSLMSSSFILCFSTYQMLGDVPLFFIVKMLLLLCYELKQVVITCYFGDKLTESSARLFDVVYAHDWISGSAEYKRLVLTMLTCTRHPFVLNVAGIADVSLITLKQVLSMSYQIFAVLKTT